MDWLENYADHEVLGSEDARTALGKYTSEAEALAGGFKAIKKVGSPYRLPESLDKLPDDNVRKQFHADLAKLRGAVTDKEQLADVNWAEGLADARMVNQDLVDAFIEHAVKTGRTKAEVQADVAFNNALAAKFATVAENARREMFNKTNAKLEELYGGKEGVDANKKLLKVMFGPKISGLTAEESEEVVASLDKLGLYRDPLITRALFNIAKATVPEGMTEASQDTGAKGKATTGEQRLRRQLPLTTAAIWPEQP